jgi:hypothetical protein
MRNRRKARIPYVPPQHYEPEELKAFYERDLEVDIECAIRDGQTEYADSCRRELTALRSSKSFKIDAYGVPIPK